MKILRSFNAWFLMIAVAACLGWCCLPLAAQPDNGAGEIRLTGEQALSAVQISIVNGLIDYVNGAKHARIAVSWEILPLDPLLKEDAASEFVVPHTMKLSNDELAEGRWPRRLPKELVEAISHDLGEAPLKAEQIDKETLKRWHEKFLEDWLSGEKANLARRSLPPRTYYALLRDHNLLYFVLRGNGIGFYIDSDSQEPISGLPKVAGPGIVWLIKQYPFLKDRERDIWVYRYGVSARSEPFDILVSNFTQEKITLSAQVGIRRSDLTVGLFSRLISLEDFEVNLEPARAEKIEKIQDGGAVKRVDALLDLFGVPELGTLIGRGLFAGSEKTSLVSGVLATEDGISGFVGANTDLKEMGRDWRLGLLFGVDPRGTDALYLGPSFRSNAVLASLGARVVGENAENGADDGNRGFRGEFGGVLSLDLGRFFGAREELTRLRVSQNRVGGDWGISSDFIGQGLGYLEIVYADTSDPPFEAVQVTDASDKPVDPHFAQVIRFVPQAETRRLFLPAGEYWLKIPPERQLLDKGFPAPTRKVQVGNEVKVYPFLEILLEGATVVRYDLQWAVGFAQEHSWEEIRR